MITTFAYPASRGYIFTGWAGMQKVASADNSSIFFNCAYAKFIITIRKQINRKACCQMARVSLEFKNCDNSDLLSKAHTRLMQCSKPVKNRKKTGFFNLFIQISGRIWTVVSRGYFSHDSSNSENVASADRVTFAMLNNIICRA